MTKHKKNTLILLLLTLFCFAAVAQVSMTFRADKMAGDGSGLTNLNPANITSGSANSLQANQPVFNNGLALTNNSWPGNTTPPFAQLINSGDQYSFNLLVNCYDVLGNFTYPQHLFFPTATNGPAWPSGGFAAWTSDSELYSSFNGSGLTNLSPMAIAAAGGVTNGAVGISLNTEFSIEQFGGIADGQKVEDVQYTNASPYIYSPSAPFKASDVGKGIALYLDVSNATCVVTKIASFVSPSVVQLNTNMPINWQSGITNRAGTNWGCIVWGTDNTPALQTACNVMFTNKGGVLNFGLGMYCFWGAATPHGSYNIPSMVHQIAYAGGDNYTLTNAQPPPYITRFKGKGTVLSQAQGLNDFSSGTVIFIGTVLSDSANSVNSRSCFIESSTEAGSFQSTQANVDPVWEGFQFIQPFASKATDLFYANCSSLIVRDCAWQKDYRPGGMATTYNFYTSQNFGNFPPPITDGLQNHYCETAVVFPGTCNFNRSIGENLMITGFENGIDHAENIKLDYIEFAANGSDITYEEACGEGADYIRVHCGQDKYGIVFYGSNIKNLLAFDMGFEQGHGYGGIIPFAGNVSVVAGDFWNPVGFDNYTNFPPLLHIHYLGSDITGGTFTVIKNTLSSLLGSVPINNGLVWDMPWITNRVADGQFNSSPALACFNWAPAVDPTVYFGKNRVYLNNGPGYITSGLDGCAFTNFSGGYWSANGNPEMVSILSNSITMEALYNSTTNNAALANQIMRMEPGALSVLGIKNTNVLYFTLNGFELDWTNTASLFDSAWHDIGVTYNGATATLFFDGLQKTSTNFSTTISAFGGGIIGGVNFNGLLGQNRIWSRALAPSEMQILAARHGLLYGSPTNSVILPGVAGQVIPSFIGGTNYWVGDKGGGIFVTNHLP